ncbi:hypothetical protein A2U01_0050183, partial [Trifolium medium]|nr:hypothetical protein [Trifolium medium]
MDETLSPDENGGGMTLQQAINALHNLQAKVNNMEQEHEHHDAKSDDDALEASQPLAQALWDTRVPPNFKIPHLPTFDGKTNPLEHLMAVVTQTSI